MTDWKLEGLCRPDITPGVNPDWWCKRVNSPDTRKAKTICSVCPLAQKCRTYAREEGIPHWVWGGEDEVQRAEYWEEHGGRPKAFDETLMHFEPDDRRGNPPPAEDDFPEWKDEYYATVAADVSSAS